MIDRATVQKIKDTADIVDVVGDYVKLIRRGANYMGLCPFHNEKTPSFSVSRARNSYHCFSCNKGGDPLAFIMEKEGLSFREALLHLAKKYGIKVEEKERTDEEREVDHLIEGMFLVNQWSMNYFEHNLTETASGRDIGLSYLYQRGVTKEAIKEFHLGYALDQRTALLNEAKTKGYSVDTLKKLGLLAQNEQGLLYDSFKGRVIFPIINHSGKVVAFGGRDLAGSKAKYKNSPESLIYKKSNILYGIFQARSAIKKENCCFLVEGYMDVIGMWQSGIRNVVASCGTALTDNQIEVIHRFCKNVILIYDGDKAGIHASLRAINLLLAQEMDVEVLLLPDGEDPDSFSQKHTPEEVREYIISHKTDFLGFINKVKKNGKENDPKTRIETIEIAVESIANIPVDSKREIYIQSCSSIMGISESALKKDVDKKRESLTKTLSRDGNGEEINKIVDISKKNESNLLNNDCNNPLKPLELDVLVNAIKYGYLSIEDIDTETNSKKNDYQIENRDTLPKETIIELIHEELKIDGINFSVAEYGRLFNILLNHIPHFHSELESFISDIEDERIIRLKRGYDLIGQEPLSIAEIKNCEAKLKKDIDEWYHNQLHDFAKKYPAQILSSHEDEEIRTLSSMAITERHQLSKIYSRDHSSSNEDNRLLMKIITSISVWKNGILENKFYKLMTRFNSIAGQGNEEEEKKMQQQLSEIIKIRSRMAKNIGDRIFSPIPIQGEKN